MHNRQMNLLTILEFSEFRDRTLRVKDKDKVPMILVGNKADLEGSSSIAATEIARPTSGDQTRR